MLIATSNNALEVFNVPWKSKEKKEEPSSATRAYALDMPGHRTDIRTLCLSSNDELLASGSNGEQWEH